VAWRRQAILFQLAYGGIGVAAFGGGVKAAA